jgi:hypothetical protein
MAPLTVERLQVSNRIGCEREIGEISAAHFQVWRRLQRIFATSPDLHNLHSVEVRMKVRQDCSE